MNYPMSLNMEQAGNVRRQFHCWTIEFVVELTVKTQQAVFQDERRQQCSDAHNSKQKQLLTNQQILLKLRIITFGFKWSSGRREASKRNVVKTVITNSYRVSVSALDLSKAFDRINYKAPFIKLKKRCFSKNVLVSMRSGLQCQ